MVLTCLLHVLQAVVDNGRQVQVRLVDGGALQDAAMRRDEILERNNSVRVIEVECCRKMVCCVIMSLPERWT